MHDDGDGLILMSEIYKVMSDFSLLPPFSILALRMQPRSVDLFMSVNCVPLFPWMQCLVSHCQQIGDKRVDGFSQEELLSFFCLSFFSLKCHAAIKHYCKV